MSRVLVVEDDRDVRESMVDALEAEGFAVASAADGLRALEYLRGAAADELPDVILLDLMMPRMDGFQFREAQLTDPALARIPVAVATADGTPEEKSAKLGAAGFLRKPIKLAALVELVHRLSGARDS